MSKDVSRVSHAQMKKLLDLLSTHGLLLDGKIVYKNTNKRMFWKHIAMELNSIDNGADKNFHKWCKMWADWKSKTKKKADMFRRNLTRQKPNFTKLELRLLKLISYPFNSFFSKEKTSDAIQEETDNMDKDSDTTEHNLDDNIPEIYKEDDKEFIYFVDENQKDSSHNFDIFENGKIDGEVKGVKYVKIEDKDTNTKEIFEDYKVKARLTLEKERLHQRSEELKLKALELKLKSEELKLKETEVSKVNYLTNIEEEKLKCMTEIAASLKELVEWTRNGASRFHNVM